MLLGHKTRSMPTHYSVAELAERLAAVNRIDRSLATPAITLLREKVTQNSRNRRKDKGLGFPKPLFEWRAWQDSNPRPLGS